MGLLSALPHLMLADASAASAAMKLFIAPVMVTLVALASLVCTFFLIHGGLLYMTSSGKPEALGHAKIVLRNALIGLVLVIGAGVLTAILSSAYSTSPSAGTTTVPALVAIPPSASGGVVDVLVKAITGFLLTIIQSIADPFMKALVFFRRTGSKNWAAG